MKVHLLGDIHGDVKPVYNILLNTPQNHKLIQLGDFGFRSTYDLHLPKLPYDRLRILGGNHDEWPSLVKWQHALPRYGFEKWGNTGVFWVAGAYSIDKSQRIEGADWWKEEELNYKETDACIEEYTTFAQDGQIDVVLSHDCPINVGLAVLGEWPKETHTSKLLYELWKIHEPREWYFGHHHKRFRKKVGNTMFRCLDINESVMLEW